MHCGASWQQCGRKQWGSRCKSWVLLVWSQLTGPQSPGLQSHRDSSAWLTRGPFELPSLPQHSSLVEGCGKSVIHIGNSRCVPILSAVGALFLFKLSLMFHSRAGMRSCMNSDSIRFLKSGSQHRAAKLQVGPGDFQELQLIYGLQTPVPLKKTAALESWLCDIIHRWGSSPPPHLPSQDPPPDLQDFPSWSCNPIPAPCGEGGRAWVSYEQTWSLSEPTCKIHQISVLPFQCANSKFKNLDA